MVAMIDDFVLETASAFGTSTTVSLAGAPTGRSPFSVFSDGQVIYFFIDDGTQWEACQGAYHTGSPSTVSRTTVIRNSAGTTSRLNFAGSARVYCEVPSSRRIYADGSGVVQSPSFGGTVQINGAAISAADAGRNNLHNSQFNITQRATGPFTTLNTYTLDRWLIAGTTDAVSISQVALSDADRAAIGDEEAEFCLQNVFTGNAGASAFNTLIQRIENVRRLSNKTVTVSFWAKANSGTPKIGVSIDQGFGTGGSPSAAVSGTGTAVTISTTWTRYSVSVAVPSTSGKTLGSNNDDYTGLDLWFSSGSTNATFAGSIGVQSGTFKLWGVQLEIGPVVTALEKPDPQQDLEKCQRFYNIGTGVSGGAAVNAVTISVPIAFPATMRAVPTVTQTLTGGSGYTAGTASSTTTAIVLTATGTATAYGFSYAFTASADL
jgi:hypothetical protein